MAYQKIPVKSGDVISSNWGNHIQTQYDEAKADLDAHLADKNNPHGVTKAQVGLGNVQNYGIATKAQAEAGTANNVYMTPLRVKEAIDALAGIIATKPRAAGIEVNYAPRDTWYTVVDVSGSGNLTRVSLATSSSSVDNDKLEIEIRIDGTSYVATTGRYNYARGIGRGGASNESGEQCFDLFLNTSFRSSLRVRMRHRASLYEDPHLFGAVDYSLT